MPAKKGNQYAKGNKGGGRKTQYKKEYKQRAYDLALLGLTDAELAKCFDVTERTINNWKESHEEFFSALKRGKEIADADVAKKLYERATGYEHKEVKVFQFQGTIVTHEVTKHYAPDTSAAIFWLKNRQPDKWRDRNGNKGNEPINPESYGITWNGRKIG